MVHQFATMTPSPAVALATESDNPRVLLTAFRGRTDEGGTVFVLHMANLGADRAVEIGGLPPALEELQAVWCDVLGNGDSAATLPVTGGRLSAVLPPLSLYSVRWTQ
jgi:hypothetical protein